jgi:hypothetical protein
MDRRLFPLAELAAFAGILAGSHTVVASARATALAESASEPRDKQEIPGEAALPARVASRIGAPISAARPPVPLLLSSRSLQGSDDAQPAEMTPDGTITEQADRKVAGSPCGAPSKWPSASTPTEMSRRSRLGRASAARSRQQRPRRRANESCALADLTRGCRSPVLADRQSPKKTGEMCAHEHCHAGGLVICWLGPLPSQAAVSAATT